MRPRYIASPGATSALAATLPICLPAGALGTALFLLELKAAQIFSSNTLMRCL